MTAVADKVWNMIVRANVGKGDTDYNTKISDRKQCNRTITEYTEMFHEDAANQGRDQGKIKERQQKYTTLVNAYYDLVTDFYEYGWGQSFHFAPRFQSETFDASIARHEHFLASQLGLRPGMKCLDVGSGVGGPMRGIARFSGAEVVGVNNNEYQVKRSEILNARYGLSHLCSAVKGDFMKLPFQPNSFDAVYAIEATCHAPDKVGCYSQVFKALKPGGAFAAYEWIVTDKYDSSNAEHRRIKHTIEYGNGLPTLATGGEVVDALRKAGFMVAEKDVFDVAVTSLKDGNDVNWYETLQGGLKLSQIKHSKIGRFATQRVSVCAPP